MDLHFGADDKRSGARPPIEVRRPADGTLVGTVPTMAADEVASTAESLRSAQPAWEDLGPDGRSQVVLDWADWFLDHHRTLGELVQAESGKAWADASLEATAAVEILRFYAGHASEFLAAERVRPHGPTGWLKRLELRHRPYPLVGIITPWNGPIGAPILDVAAALTAGAAVLSKPSEVVPLAWSEAVRAWNDDIGAPPVLAVATGAADTGAAVVDAADMVMFTGSTATGRVIATRAAERLIPCSLELGGKDPMIVLADADIDRAVDAAAWGGMFNGGQTCVSVERIYVEAPVYEEFVARLTRKVEGLRLGTDRPGSFATEVGAIATEAQVAIVERHVEDAIAKGARLTTGGRRGGGLSFEPTVLADVDHSMECMREETFGPTLPVMDVSGEDEAVALANDSDYGLSASVFSEDEARARRVATQLEVGAVNINNVIVNLFQFSLPQGGWKMSGLGTRFGGAAGVLKYCRPQAVVSDRVRIREPYWFPNSPTRARLLATGARLLGARDWRRRLGLRPHRKQSR